MRVLFVVVLIIICLRSIVESSELVEKVNKIILESKYGLTNSFVTFIESFQ